MSRSGAGSGSWASRMGPVDLGVDPRVGPGLNGSWAWVLGMGPGVSPMEVSPTGVGPGSGPGSGSR
jgi:hypothetical protein